MARWAFCNDVRHSLGVVSVSSLSSDGSQSCLLDGTFRGYITDSRVLLDKLSLGS